MPDQRHAAYAATLLRLSLAAMWFSHAFLKLLVFLELAGGTVILLGLHGRFASLLLLPVLAGAGGNVHRGLDQVKVRLQSLHPAGKGRS